MEDMTNERRRLGLLCDTTNTDLLVHEIPISRHATLINHHPRGAVTKGHFVAGLTPKGVRRSLMYFDLKDNGFPEDAQVQCAEIGLSVLNSTAVHFPPDDVRDEGQALLLYPVATPWTTSSLEDAHELQDFLGDVANVNDPTWKYASYKSVEWNEEGGDYTVGTIDDSRPHGELSREHSITEIGEVERSQNIKHFFGSTDQIRDVVQGWLDGSVENNGFMIKAAIESDDTKNLHDFYQVYYGIEGAGKITRTMPRLLVTYKVPNLSVDEVISGQDQSISDTKSNESRSNIGIVIGVLLALGFLAISLTIMAKKRRKFFVKEEPQTNLQTGGESPYYDSPNDNSTPAFYITDSEAANTSPEVDVDADNGNDERVLL